MYKLFVLSVATIIFISCSSNIKASITSPDTTKLSISQPDKENVHDTGMELNLNGKIQETLDSSYEFPNFRLGVSGGYSFRTATISSNIQGDRKNFIEGPLSGFNINGDLYYYPRSNYGFGFVFKSFNASNYFEEVMTNFYAASLDMRYMSQRKSYTVHTILSFGYLTYSGKK